MSRAFVSEDAAAATAALLPERPVTSGPNPVTPRGLRLIDAEVDRLQHMHSATPADDPIRPAVDRDLRYWRARRLSAQLVTVAVGDQAIVGFGSRITVRRARAGDATYQIVGEDEADPPAGLLSWNAPLAAALLGAAAGDEVEIGGGRPPVTVVAVAAASSITVRHEEGNGRPYGA